MKINTPVYFFCLAFFCLGGNAVFSQDLKRIDSVKNEIVLHDARMREFGKNADPVADTIKVRLIDMLITQYYRQNPNDALPYALQEMELSKKLHYDWGIAEGSNTLGAIYDYRGEYAKAINYFKGSLAIKIKKGDKRGQVDTYNNIAISYCKLTNYPAALSYLQKALEIAKNLNDSFGIFASYNNIGIVYRNQGLYNEALQNYLSCLKLQLSSADSYMICETYNNIGDIYLIMKMPDTAMPYLQEGLKRAVAEKDLASEANTYMGMGRVYFQKKEYAKMLEYYQQALKINGEIDNPLGIADSRINTGYAYFKLGATQKAIGLINEGLTSIEASGELDYMKTAHGYLSEIYKSTGNYKLAYDNHVLFMQLQDSIFNIEKEKKFKELEVKFDLKNIQNEAKIKEILARKELQNQKNIRYYTIAGMLLVVIFLIILLLQRNKIAKIRRQKALEQERNRISRDLHDNLGAQLSTARMFMSSLKNKEIGDKAAETLDTSIGMLDNSISDLRKIMNEIHTSVLHEKGYLVATEELVNKINKLHLIKFTLSHHNIEGRLEPKIEHELYRITQELVNNTLKYAQAKHVSIELLKRNGQLILMYEDDGVGYDSKSLQRGNGLNNIETRVESIRGTVEFDAAPNAGARTIIEIPL